MKTATVVRMAAGAVIGLALLTSCGEPAAIPLGTASAASVSILESSMADGIGWRALAGDHSL